MSGRKATKWEERQDLRRAHMEAKEAAGVYVWGPRDRDPLDPESLKAAQVVGLNPDTFKAGHALMARAPFHILEAWEREEVTTAQAYAALMQWEGGKQ